MKPRLVTLAALLLITSSCGMITGSDLTTTSTPTSTSLPAGSSTSTTAPVATAPALAVVPQGGGLLYGTPGGAPLQTLHQGLTLPITSVDGLWLEIIDSCSRPGWVRQDEVEIVTRADPQKPGPGFDLTQSVIVVDPGHGGRDWGAPGEDGTREAWFNLDIADRLRNLLLSQHDIDWSTGTISSGSTYPAVGAVHMTRDTNGPLEGDFEAGLSFRAQMANSVASDVLISVHNNTGTDRTLQDPPRAVFYALHVPDSDRLASLIDEELWRSLDPFSDTWQGSGVQGTASRRDTETGGDFYGLLRRSEVPAVIVEGAFVSDPVQNALLQTEVFRQAYANGVYLGLIRFLTTDEFGSEVNEPVPFDGNVGSPNNDKCVVSEQPATG